MLLKQQMVNLVHHFHLPKDFAEMYSRFLRIFLLPGKQVLFLRFPYRITHASELCGDVPFWSILSNLYPNSSNMPISYLQIRLRELE